MSGPAGPAVRDARRLLDASDAEVAARIAALLRAWLPAARDVRVTRTERVFGGNARRAWACEATWTDAGGENISEPMIMLSRVEGSQVEAEPDGEFGVLSGLSRASVRAPRALALDRDGSIVGAPSVLLERVPGSTDAVAFLRSGDVEQSRRLTLDLARAAAELHTADWRALGLDVPLAAGPAERTPLAQVERWESSFLASRLEPHPILVSLFGWLADNLPEPARISVVHGDLRPGNFLYQDGTVTALLDWEMAHLGDPVEDLAWAYRDLWSPQRFVPLQEFTRAYESFGGPPVAPRSLRFYRIFSEVKFATISLRAARAFADGVTGNLRLADRAATVTAALTRCLEWITADPEEWATC